MPLSHRSVSHPFCLCVRCRGVKALPRNQQTKVNNKMKMNQWTLGLAAAGLVSLASVTHAEESKPSQVLTALSSTTLSGYISTSGIWRPGDGIEPSSVGRLYDVPAKHDGFNLDVVSLTFEKPLDEGQWSAGY